MFKLNTRNMTLPHAEFITLECGFSMCETSGTDGRGMLSIVNIYLPRVGPSNSAQPANQPTDDAWLKPTRVEIFHHSHSRTNPSSLMAVCDDGLWPLNVQFSALMAVLVSCSWVRISRITTDICIWWSTGLTRVFTNPSSLAFIILVFPRTCIHSLLGSQQESFDGTPTDWV